MSIVLHSAYISVIKHHELFKQIRTKKKNRMLHFLPAGMCVTVS